MSFYFFKQRSDYGMRSSDWSSDVCSSDLRPLAAYQQLVIAGADILDEVRVEPRQGIAEAGVDRLREAQQQFAVVRGQFRLRCFPIQYQSVATFRRGLRCLGCNGTGSTQKKPGGGTDEAGMSGHR